MKKKKIFQGRFTKNFYNRKNFKVVFQITINNLKQIILKKDEAIENVLMEKKRVQTY